MYWSTQQMFCHLFQHGKYDKAKLSFHKYLARHHILQQCVPFQDCIQLDAHNHTQNMCILLHLMAAISPFSNDEKL
jgi:hypothetical protein